MTGTVVKLGDVYPGWRGPLPEGTRFEFNSAGPLLLHSYRKPTPREIRGARTGRMRFGLLPAGQHTLFLLYDGENLTGSWGDAPYAYGLVHGDFREVPRAEPGQGLLMLSVLVDADSGVTHALRGTSLTPAFSAELTRLVDAQRAALPGFSAAKHEAEIAEAYQRWPRPEHMVAAATAVEIGGLPFDG